MNKVLLVGRLVRDPETQTTASGIKYSRFTIAIDRPFGEDQADFVPIIVWRNQADFVDKYIRKGSLVSIEGRFSSSTYQNSEGQTTTRYEVAADRVEGLESKAQVEARGAHIAQQNTQTVQFAKEQKNSNTTKKDEDTNQDVPWDLDL